MADTDTTTSRPPRAGASQPSLDRASFWERGYTVVRQLLSAEEVAQLRETVQRSVAEAERDGMLGSETGAEGTVRGRRGDLLSDPALRHVLLDDRVLGVVGELLGGQPAYFGDSSARVGRSGTREWHRDNVNRSRLRGGRDWQDPYPLLRCGLYLQDQARHSGGLAVRPGSNRLGRMRPSLPKLVDAHAGDMVTWTLRTYHSAEVVRLRGLPRLPLAPRLQSLLPSALRVPEDSERMVLFMTFACEGEQLDYYIDYLRGRDYMQEAWSHSRFGPEVWEQAEQAGLRLLAPVPAYGSPADGAG
jgi:hypothetical protein